MQRYAAPGLVSLLCFCLPVVICASCSMNVPENLVPEFLPVQRQDGKVNSTLFPLPVVATDPNTGKDLGFLPVWIFPRDDQAMGLIFAPSVIYNDYDQTSLAFRLLAYPKEGRQYSLIADKSAGTNAFAELRTSQDTSRAAPWGYDLRAWYDADIYPRFYGVGNATDQDAETSYTSRSRGVQAALAYRLTDHVEISWQENLGNTTLSNKHLPNLPPVVELFPEAMANRRTTVFAHRLTLSYDTRDMRDTPLCGLLAQVYGETALKSLGSDASFDRVGLDFRAFQPWDADRRFVTALRLQGQFLTRQQDTPFYLWPALGGFESDRGFGQWRFIDRNLVALTLEQRFIIFKLNHYGVESRWELAPFLDVGRVFPNLSSFSLRQFHPGAGVALRAVVPPQVVGHVEIGAGRDGQAIFMGLGYPF